MAEITMCNSENCPMKEKCYRSTAVPNRQWQSWSNFECICNEDNKFKECIKNI